MNRGDEPARLADYLIVVGLGDHPQLRDASHESLHLLRRNFAAQILDRFPLKDYKESPCPPGIALFCVPAGLHLSTRLELPRVHFFAATHGDGKRVFGTVLRFHEQLTEGQMAALRQSLSGPTRSASSSLSRPGTAASIASTEVTSSVGSVSPAPVSATLSRAAAVATAQPAPVSSPAITDSSGVSSDADLSSPDALPTVTHMKSPLEPVESQSSPHSPPFRHPPPPPSSSSALASTAVSEPAVVSRPSVASSTTTTATTATTASNSQALSAADMAGLESYTSTRRQSLVASLLSSSDMREDDPDMRLSDEELLSRPLFVTKCLCVLSHFPFFHGFRQFLTALYRTSLTPTAIPLERIISNFMLEVPLPPPGQWMVQYNIGHETLSFCRPPVNNPLAFTTFPIRTLFEYLSLDHVELLLACVIMEQQVLIVCSQLSLLSQFTETVLSLIYPFSWHHTYIPLLPKSLVDFLHAPFPFLIGCHSSFINKQNLLADTCVFDLDNDEVICRQKPPMFPAKERKKLRQALEPLTKLYLTDKRRKWSMVNRDYAFHTPPPPDEVDDKFDEDRICEEEAEVQASFFRFFVSIFKNYRDFLVFPSQKEPFPSSAFDTEGFLKTHSSSSQPFLIAFTKTQAWQNFVERRTYPSRVDHDVQFFDESIIAKKNRSKFTKARSTPFLRDASHLITKTHVAPSPDTTNLNPAGYRYGDHFPRFDSTLFIHAPRYINPLGNASSNIGRKESRRSVDYLTSPTSIIYSIWFIVFTAVVSNKSHSHRLDDAFEMLKRMQAEHVQPEDFIFRLLIDACGNCGQPARAEQVLREMENAGYPPNAATYAALLQVFFLNGDGNVGYELLESFKRSRMLKNSSSYHSLAEAVTEVKKNLTSNRGGSGGNVINAGNSRSTSGGNTPSYANSTGSSPSGFNTVKKGMQFEQVFPGLTINTGDSCPECGHQMHDREIRTGWTRDINDYTTRCTSCNERFVARFTVRPIRPSPHRLEEISCEYLPPVVLKKEIEALLEQKDGQYLTTQEFRTKSPTCFWNLAWHLCGQRLVIDFLLPEDQPIRLSADGPDFFTAPTDGDLQMQSTPRSGRGVKPPHPHGDEKEREAPSSEMGVSSSGLGTGSMRQAKYPLMHGPILSGNAFMNSSPPAIDSPHRPPAALSHNPTPHPPLHIVSGASPRTAAAPPALPPPLLAPAAAVTSGSADPAPASATLPSQSRSDPAPRLTLPDSVAAHTAAATSSASSSTASTSSSTPPSASAATVSSVGLAVPLSSARTASQESQRSSARSGDSDVASSGPTSVSAAHPVPATPSSPASSCSSESSTDEFHSPMQLASPAGPDTPATAPAAAPAAAAVSAASSPAAAPTAVAAADESAASNPETVHTPSSTVSHTADV